MDKDEVIAGTVNFTRADKKMMITQVICEILRIESVEAKTASSQDAIIVRVRTDTGLEGIGEADSSPEVVQAIIDAPFSHNIANYTVIFLPNLHYN